MNQQQQRIPLWSHGRVVGFLEPEPYDDREEYNKKLKREQWQHAVKISGFTERSCEDAIVWERWLEFRDRVMRENNNIRR
jgi:hypothetical protein